MLPERPRVARIIPLRSGTDHVGAAQKDNVTDLPVHRTDRSRQGVVQRYRQLRLLARKKNHQRQHQDQRRGKDAAADGGLQYRARFSVSDRRLVSHAADGGQAGLISD